MSSRKRGAQHRSKPRALAKLKVEAMWQQRKAEYRDRQRGARKAALEALADCDLNDTARTLRHLARRTKNKKFTAAFCELVRLGLHLDEDMDDLLVQSLVDESRNRAHDGRLRYWMHLRAIQYLARGESMVATSELIAAEFRLSHSSFNAASSSVQRYLSKAKAPLLRLLLDIEHAERQVGLKIGYADQGLEFGQKLTVPQSARIVEALLKAVHKVDDHGLNELLTRRPEPK